jgi:hypothetical protein
MPSEANIFEFPADGNKNVADAKTFDVRTTTAKFNTQPQNYIRDLIRAISVEMKQPNDAFMKSAALFKAPSK